MALSKNQIQEIIKLKTEDVEQRNKGLRGRPNQEVANTVGTSERSVRRVYKEYKITGDYRGVESKCGDANVVTINCEEDELTSETLEGLCNSPVWELSNLAKRLRSAQKSNNQLRSIQRNLFDGKVETPKTLEETINILSSNLEGKFYTYTKPSITKTTNKTIEILFSDLQIGKISESWNTEIAIRTLGYYGQEVMKIVNEVKPERIIFTSLGDVAECALKHGIQSAISTDTGNAEQMANAIEHIWWSVLSPLIATGIPLEVVGVQGNHLSSEGKGMDMFKAGRYGYDYAMYRTWENMCKLIKADHVTFSVPEGHFATYEIYGKLTVAEHGYTCKNSSENAMIALRNKRATNLQRFVHRLVVGDMHHYCNYDNGNLQVNGAFFGVAFDAIEYSGIMGFHAVPAQIVNIHEPVSGVGQNTVVETKVIQVAKGYV